MHELCGAGVAVRVRGRFEISERFGPQLTVLGVTAVADGEFDPADLADGPPIDAGQMEADLRDLIETVRNPHLRRLLDALYGEESEVWQRFRSAPAAKYYHQAYRHGLLEHTLTVGQAVSAVSGAFGGIDRDVAVTGALIHDIGKVEAYCDGPECDRSDRQRQAPGRDPARLLPGAQHDRAARRLSARARRRRCCTSSCRITACSRTAVPWSRPPARRRSCT